MTKEKLSTQSAFSIDEIYQQVKGYELVLAGDFRLVRGLNKRLDNPRVGHFATTPKNLVRDRYSERLKGKEELFKLLIKNTDLNWKLAGYVLENVLDCWVRTGSPENILNYRRFSSDVVKRVLSVIQNRQSIYEALQDFNLREEKVAVVAPEHIDKLSRSILPASYKEIIPFSEEKYELPKFHIFSSQAEIIDAVRAEIDTNDAGKYAVVFENSSEYFELLKTALLVDEIPFNFRIRLSQQPNAKLFLSLLRKSLNEDELSVKDVRTIASNFNFSIPIEHDEKYLGSVEEEDVVQLHELFRTENLTFHDIAKKFEKRVNKLPGKLTDLLKDLGLWEKQLSEKNLNLLNFYLKKFPNFLDRGDQNGVQLINFHGTSYVDRPVVFELGMSSSWEKEVPERPWLDTQKVEKKNSESFSILIQSGKSTHYLVQDVVAGEKVTPSYHFQEFINEDFKDFTELSSSKLVGPPTLDREYSGFEKESYDVTVSPESTISATDLNSFVKSPKEYFFSKLVSEPEELPMKFGTMFHEFAEFYVNHPDFVRKRDLSQFVEAIMEELAPFLSEYAMPMKRTEVTVGLTNLISVLSAESLEDRNYPGFNKKDEENFFCSRYNKKLNKTLTELSLQNANKGVSGRIDLLLEPKIIDFKSSKQSPSAKTVLKNSWVKDTPKKPNYQPKAYLSQVRSQADGRKLNMVMCYFLSNLNDFLLDKQENSDFIVELTYYPRRFADVVPEREVFEYLIGDLAESNDRYKALDYLGFESYREFFEENDILDTRDKDEVLDSSLLNKFIDYAKRTTGKEYNYIEDGCKSTLKKLVDFRKQSLFENDLDDFEEFVTDQIALLNEYKKSYFPVGEAEYDELRYKDLIIDENRT